MDYAFPGPFYSAADAPAGQRAGPFTPPPDPGDIGRPVLFVAGQWAGQTIRARLIEVQKADVGRKYAVKDRRPIDPPPIVHLRLFRVGEGEGELESYDDVLTLGLMCHVDLFLAAPGPTSPAPPPPDGVIAELDPPAWAPSRAQDPPLRLTASAPSRSGSAGTQVLTSTPAPTIAAAPGDFATQHLAGSTFVQASKLALDGRQALVFVFSDLSVKVEGVFVLRYRCFDVISTAAGPREHERPVLAECFGGPFRIYSTKEFPGLGPATSLSLNVSRRGARAVTRETERARRLSLSAPASAPTTTSGTPDGSGSGSGGASGTASAGGGRQASRSRKRKADPPYTAADIASGIAGAADAGAGTRGGEDDMYE